jgi:ATP-dependent exoDNAse (exonuclease V) alpha subunit
MMRELTTDQGIAFEAIRTWAKMAGGSMHLLCGNAGTGKTFLLVDVAEHFKLSGKVIITAPTNKALKVLKAFLGPNHLYYTTHSALGLKEFITEDGLLSFKKDPMAGCPADNFTHIIVDEASMIDDVIFYELVKLSEQGKKILFVGDPLQIPPVNHENSLPFNKETRIELGIKVSTLETIVRQAKENPIIAFSMHIRNNIYNKKIDIEQYKNSMNTFGGVFFIKKADQDSFFEEKILPLYKSERYDEDIDYVKCIGWTNRTVNKFNAMIRQYLFGENLPKIMVGDKLIMDAPVFEDRKILISTNEEAEVLSVEIAQEVLSEEYTIKYYKATVRVYNGGIFNQYMLRIVHEESEGVFDKLCQLQTSLAKSFKKGSFEAKSSWIDLYAFKQFYHSVKYSYCISAHKSQGSTYHTAVVLEYNIRDNPNVYERNRILYTSCTRPSHNLYIIY